MTTEPYTPYETMKQAQCISIEKISAREYILTFENGRRELWYANKNHASYGIKYKNTHLEFAATLSS